MGNWKLERETFWRNKEEGEKLVVKSQEMNIQILNPIGKMLRLKNLICEQRENKRIKKSQKEKLNILLNLIIQNLYSTV